MKWSHVADELEKYALVASSLLDDGQRATIVELADRVRSGKRAALLADEVGMGKTRIAAALIEAVRRAGGRSAIVLPAGLGVQWQKEIRLFNPDDKTLLPLRSYDSFISGYLHVGDSEGDVRRQRSHSEWLTSRRQQRELPENAWDNEQIVMISHTFAAMQFPARNDGPAGGWRRELLPNVARLVAGRRRNILRDNFYANEMGHVHATRRAALAIAKNIESHELTHDLSGDQRWLPADEYKRKILPLIGYGLGQFDLVVVDEAHKARGSNSSLSNILGPITWESNDPFRLGMTATPVELDASQWIDTLGRLSGRDDKHDVTALGELAEWISGYVGSVQRIQQEELDEGLTIEFESAAEEFRKALKPFVLRRDKRDDPEFRAFQDKYGDYRNVKDIAVTPESEGFTIDWLRRFCAAEALSLLPQNDQRVKRARLSVAQGYGFGLSSDEETEIASVPEATGEAPHEIWLDAFSKGSADIYDHPAILAAVALIESYAEQGKKVLVFGRFIAPMNALTRLLDAREMLRRLRDGKRWPGKSVRKENILAVLAAARDHTLNVPPGGITAIDHLLETQYSEWANARRTDLARLHREIEELAQHDGSAELLVRFLRHDGEVELRGDIGSLLEALEERRQATDGSWTGEELLVLFKTLVAELSGDEDDENPDDLSSRLAVHLADYSGREGNFARMMSGDTSPQTRRLLQAAFNRPASWPMVLLAQSRVGREGLNLHEACRTIVLLHAEWNPGVVEQQIGRVDRKNSLWLKDFKQWQPSAGDEGPPRILVHPIVVKGTYDDHQWQILKARWSELRAQLHGDVLPQLTSQTPYTPEKQAFANRISIATPSFAPPKLSKHSKE
ncbi:DEAD/DEAH box helicase family protein [Devosia sp. RR2S18]|uniref:DEAD/DEAH box helicase family protein n=1 Tax=Devosia rhizosphaerae TaxID=3049774 RepID=UPI002540167E|nr:DEAD/DEAH box helicase family protein [Devosia sp. RR2S18]WIJ25792.1 helicase [Devosia sp. RR2S18]